MAKGGFMRWLRIKCWIEEREIEKKSSGSQKLRTIVDYDMDCRQAVQSSRNWRISSHVS